MKWLALVRIVFKHTVSVRTVYIWQRTANHVYSKSYRVFMPAQTDVLDIKHAPRFDKLTLSVTITSPTGSSPSLCSHSQSHTAICMQPHTGCNALLYALLCVLRPIVLSSTITQGALPRQLHNRARVFQSANAFPQCIFKHQAPFSENGAIDLTELAAVIATKNCMQQYFSWHDKS